MSESHKPKSKKLNKQVPHRLFSKDSKKPVRRATPQAAKKPSVKKSDIRSIKRLLTKADLPEAIRHSKELELKILEDRYQSQQTLSLQEKIDERYKYIKFVEKQKVERKIAHVTKQLAKLTSSDRGQTEEEKSLRSQLETLQRDLDYITFYPKGVKYISLFPSKRPIDDVDQSTNQSDVASKAEPMSDDDDDESNDESEQRPARPSANPSREEIRQIVAKAKKQSEKQAVNKTVNRTDPSVKKEKKRKEFKDPFFLHSDDENQTAGQSSLSDKRINQSTKPAKQPVKKLVDPFLALAEDDDTSIDQSVSQSTDQPQYTSRKDRRAAERNQSTTPSTTQSISQSTIPSTPQSVSQSSEQPQYTSRKDRRVTERPQTSFPSSTQSINQPIAQSINQSNTQALSSLDKQSLNQSRDRERKRQRDDSSVTQSIDQPKPKRFVVDPTTQSINQSTNQSNDEPSSERKGDRASRRAERAKQHALKKQQESTTPSSVKPESVSQSINHSAASDAPLSRKDRRRQEVDTKSSTTVIPSTPAPVIKAEPERETRKQKRLRLANQDPSTVDANEPTTVTNTATKSSKVDLGSLMQLDEDSD